MKLLKVRKRIKNTFLHEQGEWIAIRASILGLPKWLSNKKHFYKHIYKLLITYTYNIPILISTAKVNFRLFSLSLSRICLILKWFSGQSGTMASMSSFLTELFLKSRGAIPCNVSILLYEIYIYTYIPQNILIFSIFLVLAFQL